jgi:hypothetical protein
MPKSKDTLPRRDPFHGERPKDPAEEQDLLDQDVVETGDNPELLEELEKEAGLDDELDDFGEPPVPGSEPDTQFGRLRH